MDVFTPRSPDFAFRAGDDATLVYLKALQKQLEFSQSELDEQYGVNQELIEEKIWLMAYLYAFVVFFQMNTTHMSLDEFLEHHQAFIQTQRAFIQEDFTHDHKDQHNLDRFCRAIPSFHLSTASQDE